MLKTAALLILSNLFMTMAWYGHLKDLKDRPLWMAILFSWGVALFEYCFQVPANRIGHGVMTLPQLKVLQEIITMVVFAGFVHWYFDVQVTRNFAVAGLFLAGAAYFIFVQPLGSQPLIK